MFGVFNDLPAIDLELRRGRLAQRDGDRGGLMVMRAALQTGYDGRSMSVGRFSFVRSAFLSGFDGLPLHRISAPRGPRNVLWVVVVITSAMPAGDGCSPATISRLYERCRNEPGSREVGYLA